MATADYVLESLAGMDRFLRRLAQARGEPEAVESVREYLAAWPAERVARIQRVDAGWAPFDAHQKPLPLYRPADVRKICDAVHEQCAALKDAGVALAPELLELDLFLFLACTKMAELDPQMAAARRGLPVQGAAARDDSREPRDRGHPA